MGPVWSSEIGAEVCKETTLKDLATKCNIFKTFKKNLRLKLCEDWITLNYQLSTFMEKHLIHSNGLGI